MDQVDPSGPSRPFGDLPAPVRFGPYSASASENAGSAFGTTRKAPNFPKDAWDCVDFSGI